MAEEYFSLKEAAVYLEVPHHVLKEGVKKSLRPNGAYVLPTHNVGGNTLFKKSDLDAFSNDLKQPWIDLTAEKKPSRPAFPSCIKSAVSFESGEECGLCGQPWGLEIAHIEDYSDCHHHHPRNLLHLCSTCHKGHDIDKRISTEELKACKDKLVEKWTKAMKETEQIKTFSNITEFRDSILEILDKNEFLFKKVGPVAENLETEDGADEWADVRKFLILPNNRNILKIIELNQKFICGNEEFEGLCQKFKEHATSYEKFVETPNEEHAKHLFPIDFVEYVRNLS